MAHVVILARRGGERHAGATLSYRRALAAAGRPGLPSPDGEPAGRLLRPRRMAGAVMVAGASSAPAAALTRDEAARVLWSLHYAPLAGWCAAMVGDRDAAHDIASEAFVRLLSRWVTVHDPKGYLYVTATNLVRDRWRREQRDRRLCERLTQTTETTTPASDPSVRDLVERLPERMRAPVLLFYYADLSVAEVAAALHRPQGTIKRILSDARTAMRGILEGADR